MVVGLVCNIKNLVHELGAKLSPLLLLVELFVLLELTSALNHLVHLSSGGFLHLTNQTLLFFNSELYVIISSALVLGFSQVTILLDDFFALGCAPSFVVELLFLLALPAHELSHVMVPGFALQISKKLSLCINETSAALFSLLALLVSYSFLSSVF